MVHTEPVSRQRVPSPVTVARFLPSATGPVWTGEWVRRPSTAAADGAKQLTVTGWSAVRARLFKMNIVYFFWRRAVVTGAIVGIVCQYYRVILRFSALKYWKQSRELLGLLPGWKEQNFTKQEIDKVSAAILIDFVGYETLLFCLKLLFVSVLKINHI